MKKLFTLVLASFVVMGVNARQPQVILNSSNDFDIKIDGQLYSGNSTVIPSLSQGLHTVEVYSVKRGLLGIGKKRELVSSTQFNLRNNDVRIDVDQSGQIRLNELGNRDDRRIRGDRTYQGDGTGKNHGTFQGKGKKNGHYKNKNKKQKQSSDDDKSWKQNGKKKDKDRDEDDDDRD